MDHLSNPSDMNKEYNLRIVENLKKYMRKYSISQNALANTLKKNGLNVNQGNISKYLNLEIELPLSIIIKLCEIFELSLENLISDRFAMEPQDISTNEQAAMESLTVNGPDNAVLYIPQLGSNFISNADHLDFNGWLQDYHLYFFPTLSSVKEVLKGTLSLFKSEQTGVCEAVLTLGTNRAHPDGTSIKKEYQGCAIISKSVNALYVILSSQEEGELCMLNFRHFFIRHQNLNCRLASVITNSAGESHVPTVHRAFISREPIPDDHLNLLLPHLHLNSSNIIIRKEDLDNLLPVLEAQGPEDSDRYTKLLENLTGLSAPEPVYFFKEDYVRSSARQILSSKKDALIFLSHFRNASVQTRYNKVSNKADECVHNLLLSLGHYANHGDG